jgi:hypothetical protein
MKNERTPRVLADTVFRTSYPYAIPTRRARLIETVGGGAVIAALVLFVAWTITGA